VRLVRVANGVQKMDVKEKASFHIVLNVSCDFATNKHVAKLAEMNLRRMIAGQYPQFAMPAESIFDTSVYAFKKSLRLPMCGKVKKHTFEQRHIVPIDGEPGTVKDFIITDVRDVVSTIPKNIMIDTRMPVDLPANMIATTSVDMELFQKYLKEEVKECNFTTTNANSGFLLARPQKAYKCPICVKEHTSRCLFAYRKGQKLEINCYANKETQAVTDLPCVEIQGENKADMAQKIQKFYNNLQ
jgi:hypothetical protein